jgi:hypothetical protein
LRQADSLIDNNTRRTHDNTQLIYYYVGFFFVVVVVIIFIALFIRIHCFSSEVGACGEDLVSQAAVVPDLVAGEHLEVLLEEPAEPQEILLVRGLVRPLHIYSICQVRNWSVSVLFYCQQGV